MLRFTLTPEMRRRTAQIAVARRADSRLTPLPDFELPQVPEVHIGGHGLCGGVGDCCHFIRMWLNDGVGETAASSSPRPCAWPRRTASVTRRSSCCLA